MAYTVQAFIAKTGVFNEGLLQCLRVVPLGKGIEMVPLGRDAVQYYGISFCPLVDGGETEMSQQLLRLCGILSQHGTVAYIEAEYFGGAGAQAHVVFSAGRQIGKFVVANDAINQVLRFFGVEKGNAVDEFDAVGLGLKRTTDQWLT